MDNKDTGQKALKDFKRHASKCFDTTAGAHVLAYLKESYVDGSALSADPYSTHYNLGQKELVQYLISFLKDDSVLEDVQIHSIYNSEV